MGNINSSIAMGNAVMDSIPEKLHFSMPSHAGLEITYGCKAILLQGIGGNNCVFHIEPSFKVLKLRCAIGIIDRRLWIRKTSRVIPIDGMIVGICMCPRLPVVSIMSSPFCSSIASDLCINAIAVLRSLEKKTKSKPSAAGSIWKGAATE